MSDETRAFTFWIPVDTWNDFVRKCRENDRTAASQLRVLIKEFLAETEKT